MAVAGPVHVVFVHGLFSSAETWDPFVGLIEQDPETAPAVRVHRFEYASPKVRLRPTRRIAEVEDLASSLDVYLRTMVPPGEPTMLVGHSQGGLIVQRYLAMMVRGARARELACVRRIVLFACPNNGSEFLLSLRRRLKVWRHPQEQQLRPFNRLVVDTQKVVLKSIVYADGCTETRCRIPIVVFAGEQDGIVPPESSTAAFPDTGFLPGDHFSILHAADRSSRSYAALRKELLAAAWPVAPTAPAAGQVPPPLRPDAGPSADPGARLPLPAPREPARLGPADPGGKAPITVAAPFPQRRDAPLRGRDALVTAIEAAGAPKVQVLAGPGGIGKSRLALEIAYRRNEAGCHVWWVRSAQVSAQMRVLAQRLGASGAETDRAWQGWDSPSDLVWRYLDQLAEPWLLVFDDVDDPARLGPRDGRVSDGTGWLREPAGAHGRVLVTTREAAPSVWGAWSRVHQIPRLRSEDGAAVLMERARDADGTYGEAVLLAGDLGGLPMALRAAADYVRSVRETRFLVGDLEARSFAGYRAALRRRLDAPPGGRRNGSGAGGSLGLDVVEEVFALSLELLADRGMTQAPPLGKLLACLSAAPIPYAVLLDEAVLAASPLFAGFSAVRTNEVLGQLERLGLVEPSALDSVDDRRLRHVLELHPLVHRVLRDDEDVRANLDAYYGLAVALLRAATRDHDPDSHEGWATWAGLAPHAVEVARTVLAGAVRLGDRAVILDALELARLTGRYLIVRDFSRSARELLDPIIANCSSLGFARNDPNILGLRHEVARATMEIGELAAAESDLQEIIAAREAVLGDLHADTLASRHKLAKAILEQGRWAEAERLLRSVVSAEYKVRGAEHSDTLVVRHSLARATLALDRQAEAEHMLRDLLDVRERSPYWRTPETIFVRHSLVGCLLEQVKLDEAEHELETAFREAPTQADAAMVMHLRHTRAILRLLRGDAEQALDDLVGLAADRRRVLGEEHPWTVETASLLGQVREQVFGEPAGTPQ